MADKTKSEIDHWENSSDEEFSPEQIEVAGRRVRHLVKRGEGVPLLLVHVFGVNLTSWLLNHATLAEPGRTVAALDLPVHGESLGEIQSGTLDELASAVVNYMDFMGFDRVALAGHSMGGAVCLAICRLAPERITAVILLATAGLGLAGDRAYIRDFIQASTHRQLKPVMHKLFADKSLLTGKLLDDTLKYKRLPGVNEALLKIAVNSLGEKISGEALGNLANRLPVLIIWGADDEVIFAPEPDAFSHPAIEYHCLANCGHMIHVEAAPEVNRLIDSFLKKTETA